nr:hypothetical protein BgiMline_014315 [Biomphalaria glabrata]
MFSFPLLSDFVPLLNGRRRQRSSSLTRALRFDPLPCYYHSQLSSAPLAVLTSREVPWRSSILTRAIDVTPSVVLM